MHTYIHIHIKLNLNNYNSCEAIKQKGVKENIQNDGNIVDDNGNKVYIIVHNDLELLLAKFNVVIFLSWGNNSCIHSKHAQYYKNNISSKIKTTLITKINACISCE